jgi:hypothetical protein
MNLYLLPNAVEHPVYKGFYRYGETRLYVDRDGHLFDDDLCVCILPKIPKCETSYLRIRDLYVKKDYLVHRIVATLYCPCPGNHSDYIVNHLNGIKTDNRAINLEWTTYSGNTIHALAHGLRNDNRHVLVKDLLNDSIVDYYALNLAARSLNINPGMLHKYLNGRKDGPLLDHYVAIYRGDNWPPLTADDIGRVRNGCPKNVIYITPEGMKVICASVGIAAMLLKTAPRSIYSYLNKNCKKFILPGYEIMYLSDYKESIKDAIRSSQKTLQGNHTPVRKAIPVKVTDLKSGEIENWDSVLSFATHVGSSRKTIQKRISVTNGYWNRFKIEYLR